MTEQGNETYCISCGREFEPPDPTQAICQACGGPPERVEASVPTRLQPEPTGTKKLPEPEQPTGTRRMPEPNGHEPSSGRSFASESDLPLLWEPGDTILDLYDVKQRIETGGMAVVYQVHHKAWDLDLAVKAPRAEVVGTANGLAAFTAEAEAWVDLGLHPHIVSCHYVRKLGREAVPRVFAEWVPGGSLLDWIRQGRLRDLPQILDLAIQVAWGLAYAHEKGLVHRDVKPENVLLTEDGVLKVTDFGLSRARGHYFTPPYASPEQAMGQETDFRTDLWSWGLSVLYLLLGERSWADGTIALSVLESALQDGLQCPPALADLLRECFRNDPDERPGSMATVAGRLAEIYTAEIGSPFSREMPKAAELRADSLNNRALSFMDLGRTADAEAAWNAALQADPLHPETVFNQGLSAWRAARRTDEELLADLNRVAGSRPGDPLLERMLAEVHLERGGPHAADRSSDPSPASGGIASLEVYRPVRAGGMVDCLALNREGERLLIGCSGYLRILELNPPTWKHELYIRKTERWAVGVAWLHDGRALYAPRQGTLHIWDPESAEAGEGEALEAPAEALAGQQMHSLSVSQDGSIALSGGKDGRVYLWDLGERKLRTILAGHTDAVHAFAWVPATPYALSASEDGTLRLWDTAAGREIRVFKEGVHRYSSVAISPDGRLAVAGTLNEVEVWDLRAGLRRAIWRGHKSIVTGVAFGPEPGWVLTASKDGSLRLWELESGRCRCTLNPGGGWLNAMAFAEAQRRVFAGDARGQIDSYAFIDSAAPGWPGPRAPLALSHVRSSEQFLQVQKAFSEQFQQAEQAILRIEQGDSEAAVHLPEAERAIRAVRALSGFEREPRAFQLWNRLGRFGRRTSLTGAWEERCCSSPRTRCEAVAVDPRKRWAITGGYPEKHLTLWSLEEGQVLRQVQLTEPPAPHRNFALFPNGSKLFYGDIHGGLYQVDLEEDRGPVQVGEAGGNCQGVAVDPNGAMGLSVGASKGGTFLRLWDLHNLPAGPVWEIAGPASSPVFSADGRMVFYSAAGMIRILAADTGGIVQEFSGNETNTSGLAAPLDGRRLISTGLGRSLYVWDLGSGDCRFRIETPGAITALALHPGGLWAATGGYDQLVQIWNLDEARLGYEAPEPAAVLAGHTRAISSLAFSPDGQHLLSTSSLENTLRIWCLDWEHEFPPPQDWDPGAAPYLEVFLRRGLALEGEGGEMAWNELWETLVQVGYGWLRPEAVRAELARLAAVPNK